MGNKYSISTTRYIIIVYVHKHNYGAVATTVEYYYITKI